MTSGLTSSWAQISYFALLLLEAYIPKPFFQIFDPSLIPALIGVLKIALSSMQSRDDDSYGCECALITLTLRNQATIDAFVTGIRSE